MKGDFENPKEFNAELAEAERVWGKPVLGKFTRADDTAVYARDPSGEERPVGYWKPRARCSPMREVIALHKKNGFWLMEYSSKGTTPGMDILM